MIAPLRYNRYPLRYSHDGDFAVEDLLTHVGTNSATAMDLPQATALMAEAFGAPDPWIDPEALLRAIELHGPRPPVADHVRSWSSTTARAAAALAARWSGLPAWDSDPRVLNAACKLFGAASVHFHLFGGPWLADELRVAAGQVGQATVELQDRLRAQLGDLSNEPRAAFPDVRRRCGKPRAHIVVLSPRGSRGGHMLWSTLFQAGVVPTARLAWAPPLDSREPQSNYARAWYPEATPDPDAIAKRRREGVPSMSSGVPVISWEHAVDELRRLAPDVVLLCGMPIVPPQVLQAARVGVVNAHNGALPSLRGMDAVGWAVLTDQPITCTLHYAAPGVDTGDVIATAPVPMASTHTLAERVKATQLRLLADAARVAARTGELPPAKPQSGPATQYFRLHPHLKRVLDSAVSAANEPVGAR